MAGVSVMRIGVRCPFVGGVGVSGALFVFLASFAVSIAAIAPRGDPAAIHRPLERIDLPSFSGASGNYLSTFQQETSAQTAMSGHRYPSRYVLDKLRLSVVHLTGRGTNIRVAVIDSQIDAAHPDFRGAVAERLDTTDEEEYPHPHGTGIAGAILAVAPGARIDAIRVFSTTAKPESTTSNILQGLDWAVNNNVRIVNMSFTGPQDPSMERALKAAYDKGVILIAAVGNAGPGALPLFPAADPHVIAVTATDIEDRLFRDANNGPHVAIAAPGVDILVPAPAGQYQVTTGTSVAAAHVSGVVALLLERNPGLTPADVREILVASAKPLGPANQFGAGLVDPARALALATPRFAQVLLEQSRLTATH